MKIKWAVSLIIFLTGTNFCAPNLSWADEESIALANHVHFQRPVGWDIFNGENGDVVLKPQGVSGIALIKLWRYPKTPDANFLSMFDEAIEVNLWQAPWQDPTFWLREPMSENEGRYSNANVSRIFSGVKEWSCTRHYGKEVRDIVNCYTFIDGGTLAATYTSTNTNISDDDAIHERDEVVQILNGITFEK